VQKTHKSYRLEIGGSLDCKELGEFLISGEAVEQTADGAHAATDSAEFGWEATTSRG
jgi:hypothetical protein